MVTGLLQTGEPLLVQPRHRLRVISSDAVMPRVRSALAIHPVVHKGKFRIEVRKSPGDLFANLRRLCGQPRYVGHSDPPTPPG